MQVKAKQSNLVKKQVIHFIKPCISHLESCHCRRGDVIPRCRGAIGRVDWPLEPLVKSLPGLSSCWLSRCLSSRCRLSSAGVTTTSFLYLLSSVENEQHRNTQRYHEPSCFWGIWRCKWGGGNCDDLSIQRDDIDENAGLGDSSSNIKIARTLKLKKNRVRMYSIQKNKSIEKCEIWLEMECK